MDPYLWCRIRNYFSELLTCSDFLAENALGVPGYSLDLPSWLPLLTWNLLQGLTLHLSASKESTKKSFQDTKHGISLEDRFC